MYAEADAAARRAQNAQRRIAAAMGKRAQLDREDDGPIAMPVGAKFASFVGGIDFSLADEKLYHLQASEYGEPKAQHRGPKEPLVGQIDPNLIESFIKNNRYQLQLCYELALRRNELATGTMEWRWRIDSRGSISDVALVSSSIADQRMVECVKRKISAWRFPRPNRGSIEVSYPFEFAPTKG
jgi:hypothetical protein